MSGSSHPVRTAKRGCEPCRVQHLKCDRHLPACSACLRTGVQCTRESDIRFKHWTAAGDLAGSRSSRPGFDFGRSQTWIPTRRRLRFLDETPDLVQFHDRETSDKDGNLTLSSSETAQQAQQTFVDATDVTCDQRAPRHLDPQGPDSSGSVDGPESSNFNVDGPESSVFDVDGRVIMSPGSQMTFNSWDSPSTHPRTCSFEGQTELRGRKRRASEPDTYEQSRSSDRSRSRGATPSVVPSASAVHVSPLPRETSMTVAEDTNFRPGLIGNRSPSTLIRPVPAKVLSSTLADSEEAKLLWYYVENLSRAFDLADPARRFRDEVPQRAMQCSMLLNAILALSARHLSRLKKYDSLIADEYHQRCLEHLIPMLNDAAAIHDENLLISAVILRNLEEIEVPLMAHNDKSEGIESHRLGIHVLVTANEDAANAGDIRESAFWVGLRQDIVMAFINQQCVLPPLVHGNIVRSISPAPDYVWSNRMVILCADVLRYCYGEKDSSPSAYTLLADSVDSWHHSKPSSFHPVYYRGADHTSALPQLCFLRDEVSVGWQHYYVARIFLGAYDPRIPRLGLRKAELAREIDADIKENVLLLCGICQGNPAVSPNFTYAAMAIIVGGDRFVNTREQEALLHLLDTCENEHALGVEHVIQSLKNAWGAAVWH